MSAADHPSSASDMETSAQAPRARLLHSVVMVALRLLNAGSLGEERILGNYTKVRTRKVLGELRRNE